MFKGWLVHSSQQEKLIAAETDGKNDFLNSFKGALLLSTFTGWTIATCVDIVVA